jgi:hypothetical protein
MRPLLFLSVAVALLGSASALAQNGSPGVYEDLASGLLGRTVFKTDAGKVNVEILDLLVGPGKVSEAFVLQGSAVLDVQAGNAVLLVGGRQQSIKVGGTTALSANQNIAFDNSREARPFVARLILLTQSGR